MNLIIFDFNRTIYDPDTNGLVMNARETLQELSNAGAVLALVSRLEAGRTDTLESLGIQHFFSDVVFTPQKSAEIFKEISRRHGVEPEETYVIGDYLSEEIYHGNTAGMKTIRLRSGKFAHQEPVHEHEKPWRTIHDLWEAIDLIR